MRPRRTPATVPVDTTDAAPACARRARALSVPVPVTAAVRRLKAELALGRVRQQRLEADLLLARSAGELSEQRFRSVFNQQFQFMVILSAQGRVLEVSEQLLLRTNAVHRDRLIGHLFWETVWWEHVPEMRAIWPERLRQAAALNGPLLSEDTFNSSTGEMRIASAAVTAVKNAAGEVDCFVVQGNDITDQKRAESLRQGLELQLRETHKMQAIGTLAGGIAHDFNNILGAILGNLALAQHDIAAEHPAQARLAQIRKAGGRARSLVQQILAFSRRQPHELVVQPLRPIIEETVDMLRTTLPAAVLLDLKLSELPLWVNVDSTQIQQVLLNLCTNAAHALRQARGRIEIGLERVPLVASTSGQPGRPDHPAPSSDEFSPGDSAHFWVRDNGVGIDVAVQARIFEPFFTTKATTEGTGLGLSVVHGIVADHSGRITLDSALGEGSTFHVYLPLAVSQDDAAPATISGPDMPRGDGQHVLYVDDDEMMIVVVQSLLQHAGYRVTACSDAQSAVRAVRQDPGAFDIVVTDFNMPRGSGLDVARAVGALRADLPVVISSGYLSDELRSAATRAGVRQLLRKENTVEELCDVLRQVLATPSSGDRA